MESIIIGVVVKAFGIKGEVKVKSFTDFVKQRFKVGSTVYLKYESQDIKAVEIQSYREHQGTLLVKFREFDTMNDAETLRGCEILFDKKNIHRLGHNEYYFFDLKGCQVETAEGEILGIVDVVEDYPAHPVLRIKHSPKDVLIPFVKSFIISVDLSSKRIVINPLEGLL